MRFNVLLVYLISGYTTPSQPGRHNGGEKAPGASKAFLVPEKGTLSRFLNSGTIF
jgi:hypothetical protein